MAFREGTPIDKGMISGEWVRVERRGKSSPAGAEVSGAVNSIRSNTVEGNMTGPVSPGRWLERAGNGTPR